MKNNLRHYHKMNHFPYRYLFKYTYGLKIDITN